MRLYAFLTTFLLLSCSIPLDAQQPQDKRVADALALSRETKATYSLYSINRITLDDEIIEEWGAEFHSGQMHRVETPRDRIIADCSAGTGTTLNLATGQRSSGPQYAKAACGVNANIPILSSRFLGKVKTKFGTAEKIEITDKYQIRGYSILANGVLAEATITVLGPPKKLRLTNCPILVTKQLPERDIFSIESLDKSVVPVSIKERSRC
jgi:hypothetical protein